MAMRTTWGRFVFDFCLGHCVDLAHHCIEKINDCNYTSKYKAHKTGTLAPTFWKPKSIAMEHIVPITDKWCVRFSKRQWKLNDELKLNISGRSTWASMIEKPRAERFKNEFTWINYLWNIRPKTFCKRFNVLHTTRVGALMEAQVSSTFWRTRKFHTIGLHREISFNGCVLLISSRSKNREERVVVNTNIVSLAPPNYNTELFLYVCDSLCTQIPMKIRPTTLHTANFDYFSLYQYHEQAICWSKWLCDIFQTFPAFFFFNENPQFFFLFVCFFWAWNDDWNFPNGKFCWR